MGGAQVLLTAIDRQPPGRLVGRPVVEPSEERRLHGGWIVERRIVVGSGETLTRLHARY